MCGHHSYNVYLLLYSNVLHSSHKLSLQALLSESYSILSLASPGSRSAGAGSGQRNSALSESGPHSHCGRSAPLWDLGHYNVIFVVSPFLLV